MATVPKSNELKAARTIVKHLASDLAMAEEALPAEGHDTKEALLVNLKKTLTAARNVLAVIERTT